MPEPGVGCPVIICKDTSRRPRKQNLTHLGGHRLFHKAKRQDKIPGDSQLCAYRQQHELSFGKRGKDHSGLRPSTWYANGTRNSYFSPDHKIERGICNICSQDTVYVQLYLFHMYQKFQPAIQVCAIHLCHPLPVPLSQKLSSNLICVICCVCNSIYKSFGTLGSSCQ